MRRAGLTLLATLMLAVMMALTSTAALAGWVYEDCPPASAMGQQNRSERATLVVSNVEAPLSANANAWDSNPGNKWKTGPAKKR